MTGCRRSIAIASITLVVSLGGCADGPGPVDGGGTQTTHVATPDPSNDTRPPPPTDPSDAPEASAGESEPPSTNNTVVLTQGAQGAPDAPTATEARVSAQSLANTLFDAGLQYSNGLLHMPVYVACTGDVTTELSSECYVQVRDVAPYFIDARLGENGLLYFDFKSWA